jgi:hypothetical protein
MSTLVTRLCARPGCWRQATKTVRLHRDDGTTGVIELCADDAEVVRTMATRNGVPVRDRFFGSETDGNRRGS